MKKDERVKTISASLPKPLYFRVLELKARLHADDWPEFFERVVTIFDELERRGLLGELVEQVKEVMP